MNPNPPARPGRRAAIIAAVVAVLTAALGVTVYIPQQQERPVSLATALLPPGDPRGAELNILIFKDGRKEFRPVEYEDTGHGPHAKLPDWRGSCPTIAPCAAPSMGWGVDGIFTAVGRKERALTYCLDEIRPSEAAVPGITELARRTVFDDFYSPPGLPPYDVREPVEVHCSQADIVMGADATAICGVSWGCAQWQVVNGRSFVRSMICGECALGQGAAYTPGARDNILYWVWGHENMHAANRQHTGRYGGEPGSHGHCSLTGYVRSDGFPEDNPTGATCIMDFFNADGTCCIYGFRQVVDQPKPTPTPFPTPRPTPTPAPSVDKIVTQRWTHRDFEPQQCPVPLSGEWCVVSAGEMTIPSTGAYFIRVRVNGTTGEITYPEEFIWYGPVGVQPYPAQRR